MATRRGSVAKIILTYYPLCLTCTTTVLNSITIIILYQKVFRQRPTIRFMRTMAFVDIFMLYGWNLDHFFRAEFGFEIDRLTVFTCKLSTYFNHFLTQSSAWLRVWMCVDRFFTLNQVRQRHAIHRHRRVIFLIVLTFVSIALINLHLPIFTCYSTNNGTKVNSGSRYYQLYPTWNYINLAIYNILPFILMLFFNALIIRHLIILKRSSTFQQSRVKHSSISISILLSAFLFCIMTTPPAVIYAFFHTQLHSEIFESFLLSLLDSIKYTYHSLSFFLYFITLVEFRAEFFRILRCRIINTDRIMKMISNKRNGKANRYKTQSIPIATITN
jgi:hypothetical protein